MIIVTIPIALLFTVVGIRRGYYRTWALLFNLLVSIYHARTCNTRIAPESKRFSLSLSGIHYNRCNHNIRYPAIVHYLPDKFVRSILPQEIRSRFFCPARFYFRLSAHYFHLFCHLPDTIYKTKVRFVAGKSNFPGHPACCFRMRLHRLYIHSRQ